MKEIHHRVKNNLHMIVGLLQSQSEYLKGDEAKMALAESEHLIQSMSMIHQKLYQTDNLTSIEISPYIHELVQYLRDSFQNKSNLIHLGLHSSRDLAKILATNSKLIPKGEQPFRFHSNTFLKKHTCSSTQVYDLTSEIFHRRYFVFVLRSINEILHPKPFYFYQ